MKKPHKIILSVVLVALIGIGAMLIAPNFMNPQFEIVNESPHVAFLSAYWRHESREIGAIQPSSSYRFTVNGEAAMKFVGRLPDGPEIESEEIYFTGGTGVVATITESSIEVSYDFETKQPCTVRRKAASLM